MIKVLQKVFRFILLLLVFLIVGVFLVYFKTDLEPNILEAKYEYPDSQYLETGDLRVHFRDSGTGTPFILLHGTGSSLHTWEAWTDLLQDSFRIISLDLPGYGLTGPDPAGLYNADSYTEVVLALADHLNIGQFHLAGNSMGGAAAWNAAATYPDRIQKLVLLDPSGAPAEDRSSAFVFRLAQNKILSPLVRWVTPKFLVENSLLDVYEDDSKITFEMIDRYYDLQLREGNRQAFIDRLNQDFFPEGQPDMAQITAPTLLLWGANDRWIPPADGTWFIAKIPHSEIVIIPNCGHLPMEEKPAETARIVREFLSAPTASE
jgi:pimeloyl-ACP methyl ester carboxylesterase